MALSAALTVTALGMGMLGGPHCLAMCSAPCGGIVGVHNQPSRGAIFQTARLLGYAGAGAMASAMVQTLGWITEQAVVVRPLWALLHAAVLAWGLMLLTLAKQPLWLDNWGRSVWQRVRKFTTTNAGVAATGLLWALLPCGLLYSALTLAALSPSPGEAALRMALFAVGSAAWLLVGPWLWQSLRVRMNSAREQWGNRFAGLSLCALAGWALWMDMTVHASPWCR